MVKAMAGLRRGDQAWTFAKNALLQRFVELAPDEAIAWAKVARKHGEEPHQVSTIYATLAKIDPGRAMTAAQRIEDSSLRKTAINSVIVSVSQVHPEEAFRLTQTLPDGYPSQVLLFGNWAERDPRGTAAAFLTFKDRAQREPACRALMDRWTTQDPAAALEWARGLTEPVMRQAALDEYFGILGKRDPEATTAQISELPRSQQSRFLSKLAGNWMKTDPAAATAWILGRPDPIEKQQMILAAGGPGGFGYTDMTGDEVSKFVAELNPGQARQDGLKEAFRVTWKDPDALIAFAKSLPAAEEMAFRETIVQRLAYKNPDKALNYLQDHSGEAAPPQVWSSIAGGIARTSSPEKALEWANALPEVRDAAVGPLVGAIARSDPATAFMWASTVADPGTREDLLQTALASWRKIDVAAARTAFQSAEWPEDERTRWLDEVK